MILLHVRVAFYRVRRMIWVMQDEQAPMEQSEVERQASRARSIIYWVMFLFMVLPFVAAWLTGALRF